MKYINTILFLFAIVFSTYSQDKKKKGDHSKELTSNYLQNRAPLKAKPYLELPLGAIKPKGFLMEQLKRQKSGLTGNLDEVYKKVVGARNGWLGGDGDGWERGPYWIDGLLPLAYILDDDKLKSKAQKWVDWTIENQQKNGNIGPIPFKKTPKYERGLQRDKRLDWWPKMVMLKILQQYYSATKDERVITTLDEYFRYQLKELPITPLGHWSFWGNRRGGDNLAVVYWFYNITGKNYLLELADLIYKQTYDWTSIYGKGRFKKISPVPRNHCVNIAQGLKQPAIYYQHHPEEKYLKSIKSGLTDLRDYFGFVNGMYGADENLHSNDPVQGSELCSAIEMMFSFENILPISGDIYYADYLEKIAYNVLPAQVDDNYQNKQYFQQANQVQVTDEIRNFFNDADARLCYGVLSGYPCCTTNMHQGWPKFVQNMWYATADNGLAALVYGPSEVVAKVADGTEVKIIEETGYPFKDVIKFKIETPKELTFPLHLRIPGWCKVATIFINGKQQKTNTNGIVKLTRKWNNGDVVELNLPMELNFTRWFEMSLGIERGPLVYALKIEEKWKKKNVSTENWRLPYPYYEVYPKISWNYGITGKALKNNEFELIESKEVSNYPWNLKNAPIMIKTSGKKIHSWKLYNGSAGKIPLSPVQFMKDVPEEEIILIPYGCTTLRISQFPVTAN